MKITKSIAKELAVAVAAAAAFKNSIYYTSTLWETARNTRFAHVKVDDLEYHLFTAHLERAVREINIFPWRWNLEGLGKLFTVYGITTNLVVIHHHKQEYDFNEFCAVNSLYVGYAVEAFKAVDNDTIFKLHLYLED